MRIIEINEDMSPESVLADCDDIILFKGKAYRAVASLDCSLCDCYGEYCGCMPFICCGETPDGKSIDFVLKRVIPEGGEE